MNFTITSEQLLALCGFITSLWAVWKIFKEIKKPNDELKTTVAKHSDRLSNDDARLKEVEESNKMILKCMLVIINHDITGNCIDKMKEARDELQKYLINK